MSSQGSQIGGASRGRSVVTRWGTLVFAGVTAVATSVIAIGVVLAAFVVHGLADADMPVSRAVVQAVCLPYSDFVLRQHQAGLSTAQIEGVLMTSARNAMEGISVDDADACGSVQSVIDAAR